MMNQMLRELRDWEGKQTNKQTKKKQTSDKKIMIKKSKKLPVVLS